MWWSSARRLVAFAGMLLLSGCGFHMAGSRELPEALRTVYIDASVPYSVDEPPVEAALRARLRRRGAEVVGSAARAGTVIRLTDLEERREVLSIGLDGRALEFRLVTAVTCAVYAGDTLLAAPFRQSVSREYSFRTEELLAKEAEEQRLRRFIQDELADLLLLRLETALARQAATGDAAASPDATPR